jgi:DNA-binding transcriptional MerR regulator
VSLHGDLGITYRQLDHYCRRGYLHPAHRGSGYDRAFTPKEIEIAKRMVTLIRVGFTVAAAAAYARKMVESHWNGSLTLFRGDIVATGMLAENGYPRFPFPLEPEPAKDTQPDGQAQS